VETSFKYPESTGRLQEPRSRLQVLVSIISRVEPTVNAKIEARENAVTKALQEDSDETEI
jgi:hypothetical protein